MIYREKRITSGSILEAEIYPISIFDRKKSRSRKRKECSIKKKNLNLNETKKYFERLINRNFKDKVDWYITLSYTEKTLPKTEKRLIADRDNYIKALRRYAKKNELGEVKVIAVTEYNTKRGKKKIRMHHHMIVSGNIPREICEEKWKKGRKKVLHLEADENEFKDLANYMLKDPKGNSRYYRSRNLEEPIYAINDYKYSNKKVNEMSRAQNERAYFEKLYPGMKYLDSKIHVRADTGEIYIYLRFRRKDE